MNRPDMTFIRTKPQICLALFAAGGALCVVMELLGFNVLSDHVLINGVNAASLPVPLILMIVYGVSGAVIGLLSKSVIDAAVYGACLGQCQLLLPLILYYAVLHSGTVLDIWVRALCGIFLSFSMAGAFFSIKKLIRKGSDK